MLNIVGSMMSGVTLLSPTWFRNRWRWRGKRIVTCPDNQATAVVEVDAAYAARTASTGERVLRLSTCSRWPAKQGCGQVCLEQVEAAPEDCVVRNMLTRWYEGADCVMCGKPFGRIQWTLQRPAVLTPDEKHVLGWDEIGLERLPEVLASHHPICWDCFVIESVERRHPELVTHRPPPSARV